MPYVHHHAMSSKWVYRSNDQVFVLVQSTGERKLTLNLGKARVVPQIKKVLSLQTSVSGKSFLVRQPQLAQARVPKDPRGCISAASSLNSAPCAQGREEGSGGAWWLRPPYTAVFFPPKAPCGPNGGQDNLCQVVGAPFLQKKLI